jgi:hypothetical protein
VVVAIGVWLSMSRGRSAGDDRQALFTRRDALMRELEDLEKRRRAGTIGGERYSTRRQRLMTELEQIYGDLEDAGHGPRGGGEGIAA